MGRRTGRMGMVVCALVAVAMMLPAPAMAWEAFAKVTTATGAVINGGVTLKGFDGQIELIGLGTDFRRPVDAVSGLPSGKFQLGQVQIAKKFDVATPKLLTAMATNTVLTKVEITIFKTTPTGNVPGFKIVLDNSSIVGLETTYNPGTDPSTVERLELVFQKLTWTDLITGATGSTPTP